MGAEDLECIELRLCGCPALVVRAGRDPSYVYSYAAPVDAAQESNDDADDGSYFDERSRTYCCGRCGQPKKGHVCTVVAPAATAIGSSTVGSSSSAATSAPSRAPRPSNALSLPTARQQAAQLAAAAAAARALEPPAPKLAVRRPSLAASPKRQVHWMGDEAWQPAEVWQESFRRAFGKGQPVVVRGVHARLKLDWSPSEFVRRHGSERVAILEVGADEAFDGHTLADFFGGFADPARTPLPPHHAGLARGDGAAAEPAPPLLKLRDWPAGQGQGFRELLPEHCDDLMQALPLASYTRADGELNLISHLPASVAPPDIGPKCHCAYGRWEEPARRPAASPDGSDDDEPPTREPGTGTTCVRVNMADSINVLVHVEASGGGLGEEESQGAPRHWQGQPVLRSHGAVWQIFTQADTKVLQAMLPRLAQQRAQQQSRAGLAHGGRPGQPEHAYSEHVLLDGSLYLDAALLLELQQQAGIAPYNLLQGLGDAVVVPAGCAHQVRNLRSCISVAADFVAPEHVAHCLRLTDELRYLCARTPSNHQPPHGPPASVPHSDQPRTRAAQTVHAPPTHGHPQRTGGALPRGVRLPRHARRRGQRGRPQQRRRQGREAQGGC